MDERKLHNDWVEHVRDKQAKKRWLGARIWRVGRLYEVISEDVEANKIGVYDVAAQEKEDWDRLQWCSIGFRVEQPAPRHEAAEPEPQAPQAKSMIEGLRMLFGRWLE